MTRHLGGLYGLLIADALGVPYEFHSADALPPFDRLDMVPPVLFQRAHVGTPPGTWSDDGAQALALLDSLLRCGGLDLHDLGQALVRWWQQGDYAVDGRVFDIGIQTTKALQAIASGVPADRAGPKDEYDNGNGSLMRVLPLALWHQGSDAALVQAAMAQSSTTHGHLRAQVCCALYVLWARAELRGESPTLAQLGTRLTSLVPSCGDELQVVLAWGQRNGSGYVVDSLHSAAWALQGTDYAQVVRRAVSLGNDTDTTACIAGGIAGIRWGLEGIPQVWQQALRGRQVVDPLAQALQAHTAR